MLWTGIAIHHPIINYGADGDDLILLHDLMPYLMVSNIDFILTGDVHLQMYMNIKKSVSAFSLRQRLSLGAASDSLPKQCLMDQFYINPEVNATRFNKENNRIEYFKSDNLIH